jgi:hypothetical protein
MSEGIGHFGCSRLDLCYGHSVRWRWTRGRERRRKGRRCATVLLNTNILTFTGLSRPDVIKCFIERNHPSILHWLSSHWRLLSSTALNLRTAGTLSDLLLSSVSKRGRLLSGLVSECVVCAPPPLCGIFLHWKPHTRPFTILYISQCDPYWSNLTNLNIAMHCTVRKPTATAIAVSLSVPRPT